MTLRFKLIQIYQPVGYFKCMPVLTVTYLQLHKMPPWSSVCHYGQWVTKMSRKCFRLWFTLPASLHTAILASPSLSPTLYKNVPQTESCSPIQTDSGHVSLLKYGSSRLHRLSISPKDTHWRRQVCSSCSQRPLGLVVWILWAPSSTGSDLYWELFNQPIRDRVG